MIIGLVGRKCGMTRIFGDNGVATAVTVVEAQPNLITQLKTSSSDGYSAVQVKYGEQKPQRLTKPKLGHFAKASVAPGVGLCEFRLPEPAMAQLALGHELTVEQFTVGQKVDVRGVSKGKGFAGTVKRHHFAMQDATHGNSLSHRAPGSIGQNQSPGKVFKGKKMAGQMGNVNRTAQGLEVVGVDQEKHLLLIKGAVPGAKGGYVTVKSSVKAGGE